MVLWWFARGLTQGYRFCPLPRLSLALRTLSTVPAHWLHWLNTGGIIVWRFSGNPLAFGVYKPFLLGGSASGKLDASTAASSVRSSGGGRLMCLQPGPQRTSNVGTECCPVLQAFLREAFGKTSWWPDHREEEVIQRPVAPCNTPRDSGRESSWPPFYPFSSVCFSAPTFLFLPCLRMKIAFCRAAWDWGSGLWLCEDRRGDPFVVPTIRCETLVSISSCLDRTKVQ